jgi:hypothetical protein
VTTRELAARLVLAVHASDDLESAIVAVLSTLRQHEAWFCRWVEDADGFTLTPPFEEVDS